MKDNYEIMITKDFLLFKLYNKIIDINQNTIIIYTKFKSFKICGDNLLIKKLDKYELLIEGNIKEIKND